jgi:hypothetical protein
MVRRDNWVIVAIVGMSRGCSLLYAFQLSFHCFQLVTLPYFTVFATRMEAASTDGCVLLAQLPVAWGVAMP